MSEPCPECGASIPENGTCQSNFHALLYLESMVGQLVPDFFASNSGQTAHFLAVSCYAIQHPRSMGYTVATLLAVRDNVALHLKGEASLDIIRTTVRRAANGKVRVLRREGEAIHNWGVQVWPMNVTAVLAAKADAYGAATTLWARTTLEAIAAAE